MNTLMQQKNYFIFDFDSTFVSVEAVDFLFKLTNTSSDKESLLKEMEKTTLLGVEGKISMKESLEKRVSMLKINKKDIKNLVQELKNLVSPSFIKNKAFLKENASNIYIVSSGFQSFIAPVVEDYGIQKDHVFGNNFIMDKDDNIVGINKDNPLVTPNKGKAAVVKALHLEGKIHMIGDGYTDYEVKKNGVADYFYAYTAHVRRVPAIQHADYVIDTLDQLIKIYPTL